MAKKRQPRGKLKRHEILRQVQSVTFCRNIKKYRLVFAPCGHNGFRSATYYPPNVTGCQQCTALSKGGTAVKNKVFEYWNYETGLPVREHYNSHAAAVVAMHAYLQKQLSQRKEPT